MKRSRTLFAIAAVIAGLVMFGATPASAGKKGVKAGYHGKVKVKGVKVKGAKKHHGDHDSKYKKGHHKKGHYDSKYKKGHHKKGHYDSKYKKGHHKKGHHKYKSAKGHHGYEVKKHKPYKHYKFRKGPKHIVFMEGHPIPAGGWCRVHGAHRHYYTPVVNAHWTLGPAGYVYLGAVPGVVVVPVPAPVVIW